MLAKALGEGVLSDVMKRSQIDPSEVQVGDVIGAGVFGEVRSGQLHGTPVAIKTMHRSRIVDGGLDLFKAECELCLSLRHPNIVQLLGACWRLDAPTVFMVMERCDSTLSEALRDAKSGRRDDFDYTVRAFRSLWASPEPCRTSTRRSRQSYTATSSRTTSCSHATLSRRCPISDPRETSKMLATGRHASILGARDYGA